MRLDSPLDRPPHLRNGDLTHFVADALVSDRTPGRARRRFVSGKSILSGSQTRALPWCENGIVVERRPTLLPSAQRVPVPQRALRPSRTQPCGNPPTPPAFP